jgi:hypothetical protein
MTPYHATEVPPILKAMAVESGTHAPLATCDTNTKINNGTNVIMAANIKVNFQGGRLF